MSLRIVSADERLSAANNKTSLAIFGPPGSGKTSLLKTLPAADTICLDLEAGMKSVQDWPGDSIPVRTFADAIDIGCLVGGINPAADPNGFLGNIDEMMAASDSEGAVWRSFVSAWWDRFGTAEVGTSDLYELALTAEPPLPLGSGNDRAQRTRLGSSLSKMRDRVFGVGNRTVRIELARVLHQAQRWRLAIDEKKGTTFGSQGSHLASEGGNLGNQMGTSDFQVPTSNPLANKDLSAGWEPWEPNLNPYTCAPARARVKEDGGNGSQGSQGSQNAENIRVRGWEPDGEPSSRRSHVPNPPAWLDGVP